MSNNLKIIIFDGSFKTTPFVNRLAKGLAKKHTVYILGFNEQIVKKLPNVHYMGLGSNTNKWSFIKTSLKLAIKSGSLKMLWQTIQNLSTGNRKALQQQNLNVAITQIQPDLIHLQWPSVIPWFETILSEQKIPVVLSQRGYHINVRPFVNQKNYNYLQQWYPKIAGFHSVSNAISKKGDLIYNSSTKGNTIVYSGLPIQNFYFEPTFKNNNQLQIISIGRAHWIKGYGYALLACKLLKVKGVNFHYTIVGVTNYEELTYLRASLNLENEVTFLDILPQEKVYELMQESQLLLLPSIEEGIANVVLEAMVLGCPVISTNCGGMEELITHTKEGWLVTTRDPEAMAQEIMNFKKLPLEQIDTVRKNARAKIEQQFSEEQMVTGMEQLYYSVID